MTMFSNNHTLRNLLRQCCHLQIDRAELCVEDEAANKKLCLPLVERLFEYKGTFKAGLNNSRVTNLHKVDFLVCVCISQCLCVFGLYWHCLLLGFRPRI